MHASLAHRLLLSTALASVLVAASPAPPAPIGWWTFDDRHDRSGHWAPIELFGTARITDGRLLLDASPNGGTSEALGWATASGYTGPPIADKTLVVWAIVRRPEVRGGGVISLDSVGPRDVFDAITWGEEFPLRWMPGSNFYSRTQHLNRAEERTVGAPVLLGLATRVKGEEVEMTLCRGGLVLAQYRDGPAGRWEAGDAEMVFGRRHTSTTVHALGGFAGEILEARLYPRALSCAEVGALTPWVPPR